MTRVDRIVLLRLAGSIGLTLLIIYGIAALVQSLSTREVATLTKAGGPALAAMGVATSAGETVVAGLPVVVLVGAIVGLVGLQASRELTIIKASGRSVWRMMALPAVTVLVFGLLVSLGVDTGLNRFDRQLPTARSSDAPIWLAGGTADSRYVIEAADATPDGRSLSGVTVFMEDGPRDRIEANAAVLDQGDWRMANARILSAAAVAKTETQLTLPTNLTAATVRAQIQQIDRLTVFELGGALLAGVSDAALGQSMLTRFLAKIALPLSLVGSLVIAFAFTGGYRRSNNYGNAVLYGVVLGFVVYVVTEMAFRAGDAGVLAPPIAALGPPLAAIVAGITLLLFTEDGRTR